MKMIELYKSILTTGNLIADADGFVSAAFKGSTMPFLVDGKRLVLPTKEHLKNGDWSNRIVFHPLSENAMRPESKIMERFRNAVNVRLNAVLGSLMTELMEIVLNVDAHSRMDPNQADLLTKIKDADQKTLDAISSIVTAIAKDSADKAIVRIYLKRGANVNGKRFNRAAIVSFPLYNELKEDNKSVYGVTLRKKDREVTLKLLEFIIPGIENEHAFDYGSQSLVAPFLDSLMKGLMGLASRINTVVEDYKDYLSVGVDDYRYTDEWVEAFDNLAQFEAEIRNIPMLSGNEGQVLVDQPKAPVYSVEPVAQARTASDILHQQPVYPGTQNAQVRPITTPSGGLDFAATTRMNPQLAGYQTTQYGQPTMPSPQSLRSGGVGYNNMPVGLGGNFPSQPAPYLQNPYQPPQQYNNQMRVGGFGLI